MIGHNNALGINMIGHHHDHQRVTTVGSGQEQPGTARRSQEQAKAAAARSSQEQPRAARGSQNQPGATRSNPEQPEAARSSHGQPEAAKSRPEQPGAAEATRSNQKLPGGARRCRLMFQCSGRELQGCFLQGKLSPGNLKLDSLRSESDRCGLLLKINLVYFVYVL